MYGVCNQSCALIEYETLRPHDLKELTTKTALGIPAWFAAATALPLFFAPSPTFCVTSDMARSLLIVSFPGWL